MKKIGNACCVFKGAALKQLKCFGAVILCSLCFLLLSGCDFFYPNYGKNNTVSFRISGGERIAGVTKEDVLSYTVRINEESWYDLHDGDVVESKPIFVGERVHIEVEAIGHPVQNENVVVPLALYHTEQKMQAGGITISVNMKEYELTYQRLKFAGADPTMFLSLIFEAYDEGSKFSYAPIWDEKTKQDFVVPGGDDGQVKEWYFSNNEGHEGTAKPGDVLQLKYGSDYVFSNRDSNGASEAGV